MNELPVQPPSQAAATLLVGVVSLLAIASAVLIAAMDTPAGWVAGVGAFLAVVGSAGTHRGSVSLGVLMLATSAVVLTYEASIWPALVVNAIIITVCIVIMVAADLSFAARRAAELSPVTVSGFVEVHSVATLIGVGGSIAVLGVIFAIEWPGWLLLLPAVLLTTAAAALARIVVLYRKGVAKKEYLAKLPPPLVGTTTRD